MRVETFNSVPARSGTTAGLTVAELDAASDLWRKGIPSEKISRRFFISDSTFATLRSRDRKRFPTRSRGNMKASAQADAPHEPRVDANRYARAFLAIPGCEPAPFATSAGCSWPVYGDAVNPLASPTATHVCGQPKLIRGDRVESYCSVHYRVAYNPRAA